MTLKRTGVTSCLGRRMIRGKIEMLMIRYGRGGPIWAQKLGLRAWTSCSSSLRTGVVCVQAYHFVKISQNRPYHNIILLHAKFLGQWLGTCWRSSFGDQFAGSYHPSGNRSSDNNIDNLWASEIAVTSLFRGPLFDLNCSSEKNITFLYTASSDCKAL